MENYDGKISLTGHSAGGHLVSRMVSSDQWKRFKLRSDLLNRLNHVVAISPITDLRPLLKTSMNKKLKLNYNTAEQESPVFHTKINVPFSILVEGFQFKLFIRFKSGITTSTSLKALGW